MAATRKRSPKQKAWKIIQSQDNEVRNMLREREIVALRENVRETNNQIRNR